MLDERKTAILRAVVEEYITTAQPVGSGHVASAPSVRVSPATVRNEMAVLEQEGYLTQPHTSAGRIPTDKGYRFFVDHLTPPGRLGEMQRAQVAHFFEQANLRLEELLARTSSLVAGMTQHASVVVGPPVAAAEIRSVQLVGLSSRLAMVVAVLSNGNVETEHVELAEEVGPARLAAVTAHLQATLVGRTLGQLPTVRPSGDADTDALCVAAVDALRRQATDDPLFVGGTASMADAFDAVDVVRQVLHVLEQQYIVVTLVRDILDRGLSVAIGAEHGVEPLAVCSVVLAPVVVDGEQLATVGVLGPTRMNYPQALATVDVVSEHLGRRLADG
jgi:heat-inducible transcriptional repressor